MQLNKFLFVPLPSSQTFSNISVLLAHLKPQDSFMVIISDCSGFLGGESTNSLLERAKCYVLLGQKKIAIFDFTAILKEHRNHVQALCGRGFTYLMLNQQKVCFLLLFLSPVCLDLFLVLLDCFSYLPSVNITCHLPPVLVCANHIDMLSSLILHKAGRP